MADDKVGSDSSFQGLSRRELEEQKQSILSRTAKLEKRRGTANPEMLDKLLAEQRAKLVAVEIRLAESPSVETAKPVEAPEPVETVRPVETPKPAPPVAPPPPAPVKVEAPIPAKIPEPVVKPVSPPAPKKDFPRVEKMAAPHEPEPEAPARPKDPSLHYDFFSPGHHDDFGKKKRPMLPAIGGVVVLALLAVLYFQFNPSKTAPITATPTPVAAVTPASTPAPTPEPTPPPVDHVAKGTEIWMMGGIEKAAEAIAELRLAADAAPPSFEARARVAEIEMLLAAQTGRDRAAVAKACEAAKGIATAQEAAPSIGRVMATCDYAGKRYGPALKAASGLFVADGNARSDAETHLLVGRIQQATRKRDKALASYEKAASLEPRLFEARHLAAEIRAQRRDFKGAIEAETAALAVFAQSEIGKKKLTEYKAALGKTKEADTGETQTADTGSSTTNHYQAAVRLRNEGRTAEAAAELDQAIAQNPTATLLLTKARWLADVNPTGALEAAKRASAAGSGEAYYWVGSLERSMGHTSSAIAAYESYLAANPGGSYANEVQNALKSLKGQ